MNAKFRRGFKTEAEYYAIMYREELSLSPTAPMSPLVLARHLEIPVLPLTSCECIIISDIRFLTSKNSGFSAITIILNTYRAIFFNDKNHPNRQNSDIAHELGHIILGHRTGIPLFEDGHRNFDPKIEREASWLGDTLLVPRPAALEIARIEMPVAQAARHYGVSQDLMNYRLNVTGVRRQVANSAA